MAGNVWEWVEDKGRNDASRVLRGGSWNNNAGNLRAADRVDDGADNRFDDIGFRVCRGAPIEPRSAGALDAGSLPR